MGKQGDQSQVPAALPGASCPAPAGCLEQRAELLTVKPGGLRVLAAGGPSPAPGRAPRPARGRRRPRAHVGRPGPQRRGDSATRASRSDPARGRCGCCPHSRAGTRRAGPGTRRWYLWPARLTAPPAAAESTTRPRSQATDLLSARGRLPSKQLIRELHGAEVPPKEPVEKGAVVVASLIRPLVADREPVGDLEERPLVLGEHLRLEEASALFQDPGQGDDRRATLLQAGGAGTKECNGVPHPIGGLRRGCLQCLLGKVLQAGGLHPGSGQVAARGSTERTTAARVSAAAVPHASPGSFLNTSAGAVETNASVSSHSMSNAKS